MGTIDRAVKSCWVGGLTLAKYGALRPHRVQLAHSEHWVVIDPTDARARRKLIADPVRGRVPRNQRFWRRACELAPSVALDVGANYGECLFSGVYPAGTVAIGVEANPRLLSCLEQSRDMHPQRERIRLINGVASEHDGGDIAFYVDTVWSGGSGLAPQAGRNPADYAVETTPLVRPDEVIEREAPDAASIIFKIDVEGGEAGVLRGLGRTLARVDRALGLIEFDPRLILAVGDDPQALWSDLQDAFEVAVFLRNGRPEPARGWSFDDLASRFRPDQFHTDLLLTCAPEGDDAWRELAARCAGP